VQGCSGFGMHREAVQMPFGKLAFWTSVYVMLLIKSCTCAWEVLLVCITMARLPHAADANSFITIVYALPKPKFASIVTLYSAGRFGSAGTRLMQAMRPTGSWITTESAASKFASQGSPVDFVP